MNWMLLALEALAAALAVILSGLGGKNGDKK
jgi:hypothetical protein